MGEKNLKSLTLFLLVGLFLVVVVLYTFVILPKQGRKTLGSSDLVLDSPIQKWNLRYANDGIQPFCKSQSVWMGIEVSEGSSIYSSANGVVVDVKNKIVTIDIGDGLYLEYSPIEKASVSPVDVITKGESIGNIEGHYLNFGVKDTKNRRYLCAYNYLNDFTKSLLSEAENVLEREVVMCECDSLGY